MLLIIYGISTLTIILGFIALLTQKIYIDTDTKQLTQIDIPMVGKMKTNYPALIFLFLGIFLAVYAFSRSFPPQKNEWVITGSFESGKNINWQDGTLTVFPADFECEVFPNGRFEIEAKIEEGKTFEDVIQRIDYSHPLGSAQICPKKQRETLVKHETENSREYKPVPIQVYKIDK